MNYTQLKANIENFLEDDSAELTTSIDQIIAQAEEMIFQRLPNLPCFRNTTAFVFVAGTSEYIVPAVGALASPIPRMIRQVSFTSSGSLSYLNHRVDSYLRDYWPDSTVTGTPEMYATKTASTGGTTIIVAPTPGLQAAQDFCSVDYIAPETGLSSSNANTWIGDNAENVLLAACLYEASAFLKAGETLALYKTQFDEAVQLFVQEMQRDYAAEYNGGL
mgnify:CR=1 FL=1